jgi:rhodanese-related sulfurtransferase
MAMALFSYQASDLFQWIAGKSDFVLLDVRNKADFERFKVEGPYPFTMLNISYFDFMEIEDECIARLPARNTPIRIVCAKEGSAQYVAEILEKNGFIDVGFRPAASKPGAICWSPNGSASVRPTSSTSSSAPARVRAATA